MKKTNLIVTIASSACLFALAAPNANAGFLENMANSLVEKGVSAVKESTKSESKYLTGSMEDDGKIVYRPVEWGGKTLSYKVPNEYAKDFISQMSKQILGKSKYKVCLLSNLGGQYNLP